MDSKNITVVPSSNAEPHAGLLEDCEMVARLMRKLMEEHKFLSMEEAFAIVKQRLIRVCVLEWDSMEPRRIHE